MYVCGIMMTHVMHGPYLFYSHQQELLEHNGALISAMNTVSVACLHMSCLRMSCLRMSCLRMSCLRMSTCVMSVGCSS